MALPPRQIVSGVGISMCFPAVANMVTASVPDEDVGVASGVNSAMREIGAVLGVAIIALVFASTGGYTTRPEAADENQEPVEEVFAELNATDS
jgi:predicted MFS family arabinose efflux permease